MIKQAPSPGRLAAMAVFALSCFGILLFLWSSFGGPIPLAAQGYRYKVDFSEATQLTTKMTQTKDTRMTTVMMMVVTMAKWLGSRLERMNMHHEPRAATRRGCRLGNKPSCAA